MMKKNVVVFLIAVLVLSLASPAYCGGPLRKLGRGISNMITCPLEIPNRMGKVYDNSGPYEACTYGLIQGIVMAPFRAAVGFIEAGTFFLPFPEKYEPVLADPEFFFDTSTAKKKDNG